MERQLLSRLPVSPGSNFATPEPGNFRGNHRATKTPLWSASSWVLERLKGLEPSTSTLASDQAPAPERRVRQDVSALRELTQAAACYRLQTRWDAVPE